MVITWSQVPDSRCLRLLMTSADLSARYVIAVVDNVENLEHASVRHFVWSDDAAMPLVKI